MLRVILDLIKTHHGTQLTNDWEVHCPRPMMWLSLVWHFSGGFSCRERETYKESNLKTTYPFLLHFRSSGEPVALCWLATLSFSSQFKAFSSSLEEEMTSVGNSGSTLFWWKALSLLVFGLYVYVCTCGVFLRIWIRWVFYTFMSWSSSGRCCKRKMSFIRSKQITPSTPILLAVCLGNQRHWGRYVKAQENRHSRSTL